MRIDQTHYRWFLGSLALLVVATAFYIPYSHSTAQGASGGSVGGLIYGSIGSAFMLFAGLLGLRKRYRIARVGRAQAWMRGHLWLGTLSFPLILFHAGFHFGHGLTRLLMWMFLLVFVSGIVGAVLQHYLPRFTKEQIPQETIYEQIPQIRLQLVEKARKYVEEACATLGGDLSGATMEQRAAAAGAGTMGGVTVASGLQLDEEACGRLRDFFEQQMLPFLDHGGSRGLALGDRSRSQGMFIQLKTLLPPNVHPAVDDLDKICEEKRQFDQQELYHRILHTWLLVHIPFSYAILLLGAVHAVVALRY